MMKMQVKRFSILQSSKIATALYVCIGLIYIPIGLLMLLFGGEDIRIMGVFYLFGPIWMGIFGFIAIMIMLAIYNGLARVVGGIEFELMDADSAQDARRIDGVLKMTKNYKPEGYTSVAPYLIVDGAMGTIEFLKRTFDTEELRIFHHPDGKVMHAEVRIDDTIVAFSDGAAGWPPVQAHVHVYVPDVDATYKRALDAGAQSVQEPVKKDDEDKRGGVKDAGGTTWWIATKTE